ncbi:hypothetical protein ES706_04491 [subsurface metagenome]
MSPPFISGKISNLIDSYTVALNIGKNHGVEKGMRFLVLGPEVQIIDPDTTEKLGAFEYIKARIEVTDVSDKYSLARSIEEVTTELLPFPTFLRTRAVRKKLPLETAPEVDEKIKVGDIIKQT